MQRRLQAPQQAARKRLKIRCFADLRGTHLARRRWRKITAEELARVREDLRRAAGACNRAVGEVA